MNRVGGIGEDHKGIAALIVKRAERRERGLRIALENPLQKIENRAAAWCVDTPSSIAATTRSRKSILYGLPIPSSRIIRKEGINISCSRESHPTRFSGNTL